MRKTLFVAGWSMAAGAFAQQTTGEEVVLKVEPKSRSVEFHVRSGGCTNKANFGVETLSLKPLTLRLVRIRPDYCETHLVNGKKIEFTYSELGAPATLTLEESKNVVVTNAVAAP